MNFLTENDFSEKGIYIIKNTVTGQVYVGATAKDFSSRYKKHKTMLTHGLHHCSHLQHSWNLYHADAFTFEVVEKYQGDELWEKEMQWWDRFTCNGVECFNQRPQGQTRPTLTSEQSEKMKRKLSVTMKQALANGTRKNGWECTVEKHGLAKAKTLKKDFTSESGRQAGKMSKPKQTEEHLQNLSDSVKAFVSVKKPCPICHKRYSQGAGLVRHTTACSKNVV